MCLDLAAAGTSTRRRCWPPMPGAMASGQAGCSSPARRTISNCCATGWALSISIRSRTRTRSAYRHRAHRQRADAPLDHEPRPAQSDRDRPYREAGDPRSRLTFTASKQVALPHRGKKFESALPRFRRLPKRLARSAALRNLSPCNSAQLPPRFSAGSIPAIWGDRPGKHAHLLVQVLSNVVGDPRPVTTRPEPLRFRRGRLPSMKAAMERTKVVVEVRRKTAEEAQ